MREKMNRIGSGKLSGLAVIGLLLFLSLPGYADFGIRSFQFDSITEINGVPQPKKKCFIDENKARVETSMLGKEAIYITDGRAAVMLIPSVNLVSRIPLANLEALIPVELDYKKIPGIKRSGEEELEGKPCEVYEYVSKGDAYKMWVMKEINFPVRVEGQTGKGKIVTTIQNFEKGIILNQSLFEIPSGALSQTVNITDLLIIKGGSGR